MFLRKIISLIFISIFSLSFSQEIDSFKSYRKLAKFQIRELKEDGALVLRLILHKKNAALYRKAGKIKLADRIEKKLLNRNRVLAQVFLDSSFDFCKVYIIEAKNYTKVLAGERSGYFLDKNLEIDSSIEISTDKVYFMEVGNVYEAQKEIVNGEKKTVYSSNPSVQDVLVLKDKNLNQLVAPFPYYVRLYSVSTNLRDLSINFNPDSKPQSRYSDSDSYKMYIKSKYGLNKINTTLAIKAYYINKRLMGFYYKALNSEEKRAFKQNK